MAFREYDPKTGRTYVVLPNRRIIVQESRPTTRKAVPSASSGMTPIEERVASTGSPTAGPFTQRMVETRTGQPTGFQGGIAQQVRQQQAARRGPVPDVRPRWTPEEQEYLRFKGSGPVQQYAEVFGAGVYNPIEWFPAFGGYVYEKATGRPDAQQRFYERGVAPSVLRARQAWGDPLSTAGFYAESPFTQTIAMYPIGKGVAAATTLGKGYLVGKGAFKATKLVTAAEIGAGGYFAYKAGEDILGRAGKGQYGEAAMSGLFTGLQFKLGYEGYKSVSKPKMTKLGYEKAGVRGDVVPIRKGELYRSVAERTGYTVKGLPKERQYMKIVQLKQYRPGNKLVLVPKSNVGEYTSPIFRAKGYAYGKEGMVTGQRTVELRFFKKNRAYVYNERTGGLGEYKTIKNALGGIRQELKPLKEVPILKTGEISKVGFEYKPRYVFKPMYFSAVKPGFMTKNMARKLSVKTGINTNVKISTPTVTTIERVLPRTIQKQSIINREASRSESVLSNAVRSKNNVLRTVPSYWMPDEYVPKLYGRGAMMRDQSYYGLTYKFREFKIPSLEKILGGK